MTWYGRAAIYVCLAQQGAAYLRQSRPPYLLACLLSVLVFLSATSAHASAGAEPFEIQQYSEDFGVSEKQAEGRLEIQQRGIQIVAELKLALGKNYAGVWFDNDSGEFVVPLLSQDDRPAATKVLAGNELTAYFRIASADSSWEELEAAHVKLDAELLPSIGPGQVETLIDPRTNAVVIREAAGTDRAGEAEIQRSAEAADVTVEVRPSQRQRFNDELRACGYNGNARICDKPLRGGVSIEPNIEKEGFGYNGLCTAGFKATGNIYGNRFILTAGHCTTSVTNWASMPTSKAEKAIGAVEESIFPIHDWAKIKANGSYWDTSPWPSQVAHFWEDQNRAIGYEAYSYLGEYVCHSGNKSGTSCGNVTALDVTAEDGTDVIYHETEFGEVCGISGDSGGPAFIGNTALGLYNAGEPTGKECPPGSGNSAGEYGYYMEITEATDAMGVSVGTRLGGAPSAATQAASSIQTHQATANGQVYPNGVETSYRFEYGTTTNYGSSVPIPEGNAGHGSSNVGVSATLPNLQPATTYNYRLVAHSAAGTSYGSNVQFTTVPLPPGATTGEATDITAEEATLRAVVDPNGANTTYSFQYGTTTGYGKSIPVSPKGIGSGSEGVEVAEQVTDLEPETDYHFRVVATNAGGTAYGSDETFTTGKPIPVYTSSFGSLGNGNGQLNSPADVEFDPFTEGIWVVDKGNNRLQKFNMNGQYLHKFGSFGAGNGQFSRPTSIAIGWGYIWVADAENDRVQKFDWAGSYVSQFGASGSGDGQLNQPESIAVDASGDIWVCDTLNGRIQKFTMEGEFIEVIGSQGSGPGEFDQCTGIDIGPDGKVWAADWGNDRVNVFSETGEFLFDFGSSGSGDGQFNHPNGVEVDNGGKVWIGDEGNDRLQQFNQAGEFMWEFGSYGSGEGQFKFSWPVGFAADNKGSLWIADVGNHRVQRWHVPGPIPPSVVGAEAIGITSSKASLRAGVNPNGGSTAYYFQYGITTEYGQSVPVPPKDIGSGTEEIEAVAQVENLQPDTEYHFRAVVTGGGGTAYGEDITFKTTTGPDFTYSSSFGSNGSGNGQFNLPTDAAVDPASGNIWVADKGNNRIQKFNSKGEYQGQFGSYGSGNSQLKAPAGIAIDSKGNLWVADTGNRRIQKFNANGEYQSQFGSQGSGNGQFSSWGPKGIAIDSKDNIWVSDYSSRIQKFNSSGEFVKSVGTYGSGNGQFVESTGIDIGPGDKVWVGDWVNDRVSIFNEAGEFLFKFGSAGSGQGQFANPDGVEVDGKGNVWVLDEGNSRVQQFNQAGEYQGQFGSYGSGEGQFKFSWPVGLTSDDKGNLWIADTNNHRVQKWLIPSYVPTYSSSFGSNGSGNGQFQSPADVEVDSGSGNLLVADRSNNRIQKFNSKGEYQSQYGSYGSGNGQFKGPRSVAIDSKGNIWVADSGNHRIQKFNSKGEYLLKCGSQGSGNGQFTTWGPKGIAVDAANNVWVTDYSGRVQKFNEACEFVKSVGTYGSGAGQFAESAGIDIGPGNKVWVSDWVNDRVSVFNEAGEFLFKFGSSGSGNGQLDGPDGVEVDSEGNVWILDANNSRVQQFNQAGEYVTKLGSYGSGEGQFKFSWPVGLTSDDKGNFWIADVNNHRVQKWLYAD